MTGLSNVFCPKALTQAWTLHEDFMTPNFTFEGIYAPIFAPLLLDGNSNHNTLADQVDHLVQARVLKAPKRQVGA